jgi:carbon-monoxide dehydrogenase medium subunit
MVRYEYYKPSTIPEAMGLAGQFGGDALYVAGGTDVMVSMRRRKLSPRALISLCHIQELARIDLPVLGAGMTHRQIQENDTVRDRFSALHDAVSHLGSPQIRNVATVGGNICNGAPSADTACPLLVLDAEAVIAGPAGDRRVPLEDFFVGPGRTVLEGQEILKALPMASFGENTSSAYIKHTRRNAMDLPIVGVAVRITVDRTDVRCRDVLCGTAPISEILAHFKDEELRCEDIRIAMGVVGPRPLRARKAEASLKGRIVSEEAVAATAEIAASESTPRDSVRGEAWYRREMVSVLVRRAVMKSIDRILRPDERIYPDRLW